jgi:hypothetical protein
LTEGVGGGGTVLWKMFGPVTGGKEVGWKKKSTHRSLIIRTFQKARFVGVIKLGRLRMATQALSTVTRQMQRNLTFMDLCIVNVFSSITNKMQRYTIYLFL